MWKKIKIGNLELQNNLLLAPMSGVNTYAFRKICKNYGCGLVSTEFYSANALARKPKLLNLIDIREDERPVSVQIFSGNTENIVKTVKLLQQKADIIDINLGCPAPKIMRQGAGAALLARLNKIKEILESASKASEKPITAKIRLGMTKNSIKVVEIAKIAEKYLDALTIHARTVSQGYSGKADWSWIAKVKQEVSIPIIANGDIVDGISAKKCIETTNCDGVMIGRAAIMSPAVFEDIITFFKTGKINQVTEQAKKQRIKKIFNQYLKYSKQPELNDLKIHAIWLIKGIRGAARIREKLSKAKTVEQIINVMNEF